MIRTLSGGRVTQRYWRFTRKLAVSDFRRAILYRRDSMEGRRRCPGS